MTLYNFLLQAALVGCIVALIAALRRGWAADPVARIEFAAEARGWALASLAHVSRADRRAIAGEDDVTPETLDGFITALSKVDRETMRQCRHLVRALVLSGSNDFGLQDIGDARLDG